MISFILLLHYLWLCKFIFFSGNKRAYLAGLAILWIMGPQVWKGRHIKKIKYLGSKNCQILNQQKQEVLETIEKWTIILQPNSSSEAKIQDSWDRRTLTFILKRRQKWRMLNDFRWGLSLVCVASVMWIDVVFSPTDWRIERQMMDREISNI